MRASGAPLADPPANSGGHPRPGPADGPGERSAVAGRPIILLYNSAWGRWPDGSCATADCEFTTDRSRLPEAQAVVFHVPTLTAVERVPKYPGQLWVAWCMESAVTCPRLADGAFMRHFEVGMTYQRDAAVWTPYINPAVAAALIRPPRPKTAAASAVYLQSSRVNASGRVQYVAELMKRVKVDSYGAVLRNRAWPFEDAGQQSKLDLIASYKFTLAFENSVARDYVTEKFYDPLIAGSVPVYLGAPNVADFAPADGCFINAADFGGPAELAAHLNRLSENDTAYSQYLRWKSSGLDERFVRLVEPLARTPLERLCVVVRDHGHRPMPIGGRPTRPLAPSWRDSLARMLSRLGRTVRR